MKTFALEALKPSTLIMEMLNVITEGMKKMRLSCTMNRLTVRQIWKMITAMQPQLEHDHHNFPYGSSTQNIAARVRHGHIGV